MDAPGRRSRRWRRTASCAGPRCCIRRPPRGWWACSALALAIAGGGSAAAPPRPAGGRRAAPACCADRAADRGPAAGSGSCHDRIALSARSSATACGPAGVARALPGRRPRRPAGDHARRRGPAARRGGGDGLRPRRVRRPAAGGGRAAAGRAGDRARRRWCARSCPTSRAWCCSGCWRRSCGAIGSGATPPGRRWWWRRWPGVGAALAAPRLDLHKPWVDYRAWAGTRGAPRTWTRSSGTRPTGRCTGRAPGTRC